MKRNAMIGEVASLKALAGYRGRPAGDIEGLARALVALSRLAVRSQRASKPRSIR